MTPLSDIIARIEAGETGRELEAAIAANLRVGTEHQWAMNYPTWEGRADGRVYLESGGPSFSAPAYLTSLDAAVSLVPIGATWTLLSADPNEGEPDGPQPPFATVVTTVDAYHAVGPTPAAALTAAALKARLV